MRRNLKFGIELILLFLLAVACTSKKYYEDSGEIFHTTFHIKYEAKSSLYDSIQYELQRFDNSLNPFNPHSVIARVNRNEPVVVDELFKNVFNRSMEIARLTDGMFDITSAPYINLWGFGFQHAGEVTPATIDSLRAFVGYRKVRLNGQTVEKDDPRLTLNCSAIAKGYACDVIAALLERNGVTNYMVEIGGEVTMQGVNATGECWRIGINKPAAINNPAQIAGIEEIVSLCKKGGVATSGNYRNYYVKDGKTYAHTINPLTGYPAEQEILSATIVASDCMTADALATASMVMGLERTRELINGLPGIEYFLIYATPKGGYRTEYSKGMLQYLPERGALSILENL